MSFLGHPAGPEWEGSPPPGLCPLCGTFHPPGACPLDDDWDPGPEPEGPVDYPAWCYGLVAPIEDDDRPAYSYRQVQERSPN
jgi:hypothetical protein